MPLNRGEQWLQTAVAVRPLGGTQDDAPNLAAAYAYGASSGRAVVLERGHYLWKSAQELPRTGQLTVVAYPGGVTIESTLPADGLEANAPFNSNPVPPAAITTLSADAVKGSPVIHVVDASGAGLAPGSYIRLEVDPTTVLRIATYIVVARDIGAKTVTLDRPVRRTFPAASIVAGWTPLVDFRLYGNSLRLTGTGDRGIEIVGGWNCYVEDVFVDGDFRDFVCGFDLGSTKCTFNRVRVNGNGVAAACVTFENSELCTLRDSLLWNADPIGGLAGLLLPGAVDFVASGVHAWGCLDGCDLTVNDPSNTEGGDNIAISDSTFNGNSVDGIAIRDGTTNVQLSNVTCSYNTAAGIRVSVPVGSNGVAPERVRFSNLVLYGNAGTGLFVDSATDVVIHGISTLDNGGTPSTVACEVYGGPGARITIYGGRIQDTVGFAFRSLVLARGGDSQIRLIGGRVESTSANQLQLVECGPDAGSRLSLENVLLNKVGIGICMQVTGANSEISARKVTCQGSSYPVLLATGGVLHLDHETSLDAGTVPQSKIDVGGAAVFTVDAPVYPGIQVVPLPAGGVLYLTWPQFAASVIQFTTGAAVGLTAIGVPPVRTRQRIVNASTVSVVPLAVDNTGTPIGGGPTIAAGTAADIIFDGTNVVTV